MGKIFHLMAIKILGSIWIIAKHFYPMPEGGKTQRVEFEKYIVGWLFVNKVSLLIYIF